MYSADAPIGVLTNADDWIVVQRTASGKNDNKLSVSHVPGLKPNGESNILDILLAMSLYVRPKASSP